MTISERKIYAKKWRNKNKLRNKEYAKQWYLKNITRQRAYGLQYAKEHRLLRNLYCQKYRIKHPALVNWCAMMRRCYDKVNKRYAQYGGRGIQVYKPWHTFKIYEKEFGYLKPSNHYTVDRINNNGHYEPENVQWLTRVENTCKGRNL